MAEWVSVAFSALSSVLLLAMSYGVFKAKIDRLERSVDQLYESHESMTEKYVSQKHFESVINDIQENQREIGRDIRSILALLSKHGNA